MAPKGNTTRELEKILPQENTEFYLIYFVMYLFILFLCIYFGECPPPLETGKLVLFDGATICNGFCIKKDSEDSRSGSLLSCA